jgi:hypothetical protein
VISSSVMNPKTLRNLERSTWVVGSITLATVLILAISSIVNFVGKRQADAQVMSEKSQVKELSDTIARAKKIKTAGSKRGLTSQVQALMDESTKKNNVTLLDFQALSDAGPFLTRYKKNGTDTGWLQTGITASLRGTLTSVYSVLKDMSQNQVPVEFDSIEIQRYQEGSAKEMPKVAAKIVFRVLKQEVPK